MHCVSTGGRGGDLVVDLEGGGGGGGDLIPKAASPFMVQ